jgi:hypothetical protein
MTATPPTPLESKSSSRRALLAGALGGIGAWAAGAIGRPTVTRAGSDGDVVLGGSNTTTSTTSIHNSANSNTVFTVDSISGRGVSVFTSSAVGVYGDSIAGAGLYGVSGSASQAATVGRSTGDGTGVQGYSGPSIPAAKAKTGVYGRADRDANSRGVVGESPAGIGVEGISGSGTAVHGISGSFIGLHGESASSIAVEGYSTATDKPASRGWSAGNSTGMLGHSGAAAPPAPMAKTGVYGYAAQDNFIRGVTGESPACIGLYGISSSGYAGYFAGKVYTTKYHELTEISTPAAPLTNRARLFLRDNGSGLTQLCVRFHTGSVKVLATQT